MKYDFEHWDKTEMTQEEALALFASDFEVFDGKRCSPTCPRCQAEEWAIKALKTMSDTISRQAAIDAIRASASKYTGFMAKEIYTDDDAVEAIKGVPSVQSERKKGKWIKTPEFCGDDVSSFIDNHFRCSECKKEAEINSWGFYILSDFCPNCGAEMEKTNE